MEEYSILLLCIHIFIFIHFRFKSVLDFGNYKKFHPDFHIEESILDPVEALSKRKPVRFIKTHLPWNLLPLQIQNQTKNAKVISNHTFVVFKLTVEYVL